MYLLQKEFLDNNYPFTVQKVYILIKVEIIRKYEDPEEVSFAKHHAISADFQIQWQQQSFILSADFWIQRK